ncbi:MAG TPA: histidine kinase [Jatrophihabitantaceae bacterium]|jgi:two-component system sensor histidine kinase DesK|nr:histidine kinase [Jatrophihabitantaceae bacterium]
MSDPTAQDPYADETLASDPISRQRARHQTGRTSWHDWVFPGLWLVYLGQTVHGVSVHSHGAAALVGYAIIIAFAFGYLLTLNQSWDGSHGHLFWISFTSIIVLAMAEPIFAHEDAFAMLVYIAVVFVAAFRKQSVWLVGGLTIIAVVAPSLVPSWNAGPDWNMAITLPLVAVAMWAFFAILQSNVELTKARAEVARLAAENERSRIARDLHDLLGHSLTTITVKAELAKHLSERDPARAAAEIAEVEALSRRTLSEVRAAVSGYREVTLSGELATGRQVLRAAGFVADLPKAVDDVDPNYEELFGWVVREGITNVVRHSRGTTCTITVGRNWLTIADDGTCVETAVPGSGLIGLGERVAAAGGTVVSGCADDGPGWRLRVDLPANETVSVMTDPAQAQAGT